MVAEVGYIIDSKLIAFSEYPWEQTFLELYLRSRVGTESPHTSMNDEERASCVATERRWRISTAEVKL
jgi:hypothetical protein